jgi:hypothetical protein
MQPQREEYYLLINGDTAGPYTLAELHQMWMDDKITLDTLFVRPGMRKCQPINLILGMVINYHAAQPAEEAPLIIEEEEHPLAPFKGLLRWGLMGVCLVLFVWLIGPWRVASESKKSEIMRAVVAVKPADLNIFNESEFEWREVYVHLNGSPPGGYKRKLNSLPPGMGKDLTLLEFTDTSGASFEPWNMSVTEVWIGNEKMGYRTFRVRLQPLQ